MTRWRIRVLYRPLRYWIGLGAALVIGLTANCGLSAIGYGLITRLPMCGFLGLCWFSFFNNRWPIYEIISVEKDDE